MPSAKVAQLFEVLNVDLKTVANHSVLTARAKRVLVSKIQAVLKTLTGAGSDAVVSLGTDTNCTNILSSDTSTKRSVETGSATYINRVQTLTLLETNLAEEYLELADLTTNGLRLRVETATGATAATADFYIWGAII